MNARRLLNIGGGHKGIGLPPDYADCEHVLLDAVDGPGVDVVRNAVELVLDWQRAFDVVYLSHCLEHLDENDGRLALRNAWYYLRDGGTLDVRVPDVSAVMHRVSIGAGLLDVLQHSADGPIRAADILWGHQRAVMGRPLMAHRYGYDAESLWTAVVAAGWTEDHVRLERDTANLELRCEATK